MNIEEFYPYGKWKSNPICLTFPVIFNFQDYLYKLGVMRFRLLVVYDYVHEIMNNELTSLNEKIPNSDYWIAKIN